MSDMWLGIPICLALLLFMYLVRRRWAIRRWPFLGPRFDAAAEQPAALRAENARLREALEAWEAVDKAFGFTECEHRFPDDDWPADKHPDDSMECFSCGLARSTVRLLDGAQESGQSIISEVIEANSVKSCATWEDHEWEKQPNGYNRCTKCPFEKTDGELAHMAKGE